MIVKFPGQRSFDAVEATPSSAFRAVAERSLVAAERCLPGDALGLGLRYFYASPVLPGIDGFHAGGRGWDLREIWLRVGQPLDGLPGLVRHEAAHAFGCLVLGVGASVVTEAMCDAFARGEARPLALLYAHHELAALLKFIPLPSSGLSTLAGVAP